MSRTFIDRGQRRRSLRCRAPSAGPLWAWSRSSSCSGSSSQGDDFSLQRIPQLADRQIDGEVSGAIEIAGLGYDARLDGDVRVDGLELTRARIRQARLQLDAGDGRMDAEPVVRQEDGWLTAETRGAIDWGDRLVPALGDELLLVRARSDDFGAGVLLPLLDRSVSKLDGLLDADLELQLDARHRAVHGSVALDDGVIQIPTIGTVWSSSGASRPAAPPAACAPRLPLASTGSSR